MTSDNRGRDQQLARLRAQWLQARAQSSALRSNAVAARGALAEALEACRASRQALSRGDVKEKPPP
jgi:hypothetical protein